MSDTCHFLNCIKILFWAFGLRWIEIEDRYEDSHRISQRPPLAGPTRHSLPWSFSLSICLSTARLEIPRRFPSWTVVTVSSWRIRVRIWSSVFTLLFGELSVSNEPIRDLFSAFRWTVTVNRQPSLSSVKSISGQASSARLMPEPIPRYGNSPFAIYAEKSDIKGVLDAVPDGGLSFLIPEWFYPRVGEPWGLLSRPYPSSWQ